MSAALLGGLLAACSGDEAPAEAAPPNIVLVSIDTLRGDRLGSNGNPDGLTPNLDRFAAEGIAFTQAYSQTNITNPSHRSLFSSLYPTEVASLSEADPEGQWALAQVLRLYGYQTAARTAGGDLAPEVGPTLGFDSYTAAFNFASLYHTAPLAMEWLDATDPKRPFFLFIHGYDTHTTYLKPTPFGALHAGAPSLTPERIFLANATERVVDGQLLPKLDALQHVAQTELRPRSPEARERLAERTAASREPHAQVSDADIAFIHDLYDGAVSYADTQFGLLMAELQAGDRLDDTVVVVVGDHGEALGETGLFHRCCDLDDAMTHVPLLLRLPRAEEGGRRIDTVVELIDVMPTLLELAGATIPAGLRGVSLVPALHGRPVEAPVGEPVGEIGTAYAEGGFGWRQVSVRTKAGRLTYTGVQATTDLIGEIVASARLPGPAFTASEGLNAAQQSALRADLSTWVDGLVEPAARAPKELPSELRDALRQRGYWDR